MRMRQTVPLGVVVVVAAAAMFVMLLRVRPDVARATTRVVPPKPVEKVVPPPQAAPPAPPIKKPAAYPRLLQSGFEGMTPDEMVSRDAVVRAFPGVTVRSFDPTELVLLDKDGYELASVYGNGLGAYKVSVVRGITTEHGISVGEPLSDVLKLDVPHRCEQISSLASSAGPVYRGIRCWVGKKPARFRYVASLPDSPFGTALALDELKGKHLISEETDEEIPQRGKALDRWIQKSDVLISEILWRNDLEAER